MTKIHRVRTLGVSFGSAVKVLQTRTRPIVVGSEPVASLGTDLLGLRVEHDVEVSVGSFDVIEDPVHIGTLRFRVQASEHPERFPVLEGDLELTPTDTGVELALEGSYHVPGGLLGALADRGGMHRVVDQSIDRMFEGVARRLASEAGSMDAMTGVPV